MRSARSSATRTAGSSSTTITVAAPGVDGGWPETLIGRESWTPRRPEDRSGRLGRGATTSRAPQGTSKMRIKVSEETPAAPAPRGREGTGRPRGRAAWSRWLQLVRAGAELDLDLALVARPADREGDLVAGLVGVDRGDEGVGRADRLAVDRGDDVAALEAGVGRGAARGGL